MGLAYTGWELPEWERRRLVERFPPIYAVDPDLQHHVTFAYGVNDDSPLPVTTSGLVVGHADDLKGVQALVMEIACSVTRPDGSIYHITWSLDRAAGRKPVESNAVLLAGWRRVEPIRIGLIPRFFGSSAKQTTAVQLPSTRPV
jgi:hypothetical protein